MRVNCFSGGFLLSSLSLYSTVTRKHSHWAIVLGNTPTIPQTREFCVGDTNMLVSKNPKICITTNANAKICLTPNANPHHEPVEYSLHWVCQSWVCIGRVDFMLFISFLVVLGTQRKRNSCRVFLCIVYPFADWLGLHARR